MSGDIFDFDPDITSDDHFKVLGLNRPTTRARIKAAHRRLVETYHPDRNKDPGASAILKRVNQARDACRKQTTGGAGPRGARGASRERSNERARSEGGGAGQDRRGQDRDQGKGRRTRSSGQRNGGRRREERTDSRERPPPPPPPPPPREPIDWPDDLTTLQRANLMAPGLGNALASKGKDGVLYLANFGLTVALVAAAIVGIVSGAAEDLTGVLAAAAVLLGLQAVAIWGRAVLQSSAPVELDHALMHERRTQLLAFGGTAVCMVVTAVAIALGAAAVPMYVIATVACSVASLVVPLWFVWRLFRGSGR